MKVRKEFDSLSGLFFEQIFMRIDTCIRFIHVYLHQTINETY